MQSTEIEIKLSELRTKLRALQAGPPADDATEEVRAAHDTEVTDGLQKLDDLETQKRTALKAEEVAQERALKLVNIEQRVGAGDMPNIPTEIREYMGVEARCEMAPFLAERSRAGARIDGAEAELRSIFGIDEPGVVPWGLFLEPKRLQEIRQEQRQAMAQQGEDRLPGEDASLRAAFAPGSTIMSMQDPIIQEVFASSTAAFLGTRFSSAPVGDSLQFVLTTGSAGFTADGTDRAQAGSLAAVTLTPKALRASYLINKSDLMRVRGLESALRADMPRAIADVLDHAVINGAASGSVSDGIIHTVAPRVGGQHRCRHLHDRYRIRGHGRRWQVRAVAQRTQDRRVSDADEFLLRAARVEHGGDAGRLPHDEQRRHHDDLEHADRHPVPGHHLQDGTRHDGQRRREDVGPRNPDHPGRAEQGTWQPARLDRERLLRLTRCCGRTGSMIVSFLDA